MKVTPPLRPTPSARFAAQSVILRVDTLRIRYEPGQPIDPGFAQRIAELTGGQTLDDLYQAHLAQEAAQPPRQSRWSWLTRLFQHPKPQ